MKATDLLKAQHDEVKSLFKRIERSKKDGERRELFEELAAKLVGHDGIEREIFYPACKKAMGPTELLGEALVEHGVIEFSLYLADQARGKDDFTDKVTVLSEMVLHHVKEEEGELFPKVEKAMTAEVLEALGDTMEARFAAAQREDFRRALHQNLRRVLDGATEISARKGTRSAHAQPEARADHGTKKVTAEGRMKL